VGSHGMSFDASGDLWFTNGTEGMLTKFEPKTERFVRYPRPPEMSPVGFTYARRQ
jgi:streptogramin lyase